MDHEKAFIESLKTDGCNVVTISDECTNQERYELTLIAMGEGRG